MAIKPYAVGLKRSALALALGLCFAGGVQAQSSVGSIFGEAAGSATVQIENLDTGLSRSITADAAGRFTFSQLPPGRYRVTSGDIAREVQVNIGTGTPVALTVDDTATLGTVTVVGSGAINPIDVSSVESTSIFTAQQLRELPVARDITNVALLAPGTVRGDTGFGNLASFGGSSVAENGYYINGFDVTNIRNFISYASLPFEAIGEQQIKTGGYGAEYGRSLGGVINILTKRGTNEWQGGASLYWTPEWGREHSANVVTRDPLDLADGNVYFVYREDDEATRFSYNVYGGGPIVKDRLFFFGLVEGRNDSNDIYNRDDSQHNENDSPNGMVKLDWNITNDHILEFTGIYNKSKTDYQLFNNGDGQKYVGEHQIPGSKFTRENGGKVYIGKYTGYLTDNFTISAMAGKLTHTDNYQTPEGLPGADCPRAFDSRTNPGSTTYIGCWDQAQTFIRDPDWGPDKDTRKAYRLDAEWSLGDHLVRFGYDSEKFESGHAGQVYTGGEYWRFFQVGSAETVTRTSSPFFGQAGREVNGALVGQGQNYARRWISQTTSGSYAVENKAFYIEDSWQVTDNVLAYLGVRSEAFENFNAQGDSFVKADHLIAPRMGFSWDVNGDSTFKVFGNAGRYFIPVASNTNIRASGGEVLIEDFFLSSGVDASRGEPTGLGSQVGQTNVNGSLDAPDSRTLAVADLDPMYQDEFILGFQKQLSSAWTVGMRAISRKVKSGMDDYCSHQPFLDWAEDNGYTDFDPDSMAGCFVINPGKDIKIAMDLQNDGNFTIATVPNSYLGLPSYQRTYKALEFFWERNAGDNWYMQGSYTYARSRGNVEGYVNSTLEQDDAGLTQDFDHRLFEDGAYGDLPNDRRHTIKLFGSYKLSDEWRVGANLLAQSGRPVNCNGYIPLDGTGIDEGNLVFYSASSFYCLDQNLNTVLGHRGDHGRTPWIYNLDTSLAYTPEWAGKKLTLQMDVFNILNLQRVTEYYEVGEASRSTPTFEPNFLNDVNYQSPRSIRFSARYDF